MIYFSSKYRSRQPEIMDASDFHGEEMKKVLTDIRNMNKWLGGDSVALNGITKLLKELPKDQPITILDVGCGDGEMLRNCHQFGQKNGYDFKLIGIDFNPNIIRNAEMKSEGHANISYQTGDVFRDAGRIPKCDIAMCNLFLHHFDNSRIIELLTHLVSNSKIGVVVNDLHRHRISFLFFKLVKPFLLKTETARSDGSISIARGFRKRELIEISKQVPGQKSIVKWMWAFRYQWILKKSK